MDCERFGAELLDTRQDSRHAGDGSWTRSRAARQSLKALPIDRNTQDSPFQPTVFDPNRQACSNRKNSFCYVYPALLGVTRPHYPRIHLKPLPIVGKKVIIIMLVIRDHIADKGWQRTRLCAILHMALRWYYCLDPNTNILPCRMPLSLYTQSVIDIYLLTLNSDTLVTTLNK